MAEDWMEPLGLSIDSLRTEVGVGWVFNLVWAMARADLRSVVIMPSKSVASETAFIHEPTGAKIVLVPSPAIIRWLRDTRVARRVNRQQVHEVVDNRRTFWRTAGMFASTPMRALARAVRRHACDVIMCQDYEHPRFDQAVLIGRILRRPVVAIFQGVTASSRVERIWRARSVRASAGLIIPSRRELARVRRRYGAPPPPIINVLNPLDLDLWRPGDSSDARSLLGVPADARVVAWHGRVYVLRKGLDVLVDAWERLSKRHYGANLVLLLLGTGPDAPALRKMIADRQLGGIIWRDEYVNDPQEIMRHLWAADAFAFPSRREGLPVAPMEAMACGVPIIAADEPGAADIIDAGQGTGGLLVPTGDAEALAEGLEYFLFNEDARSTASAAARRTVESSASFAAVSRSLDRFLSANVLTQPNQ